MKPMNVFAVTAAMGLAGVAALWLWHPLPADLPHRVGATRVAPRAAPLRVIGLRPSSTQLVSQPAVVAQPSSSELSSP